jgi:hypothetical protein
VFMFTVQMVNFHLSVLIFTVQMVNLCITVETIDRT